MIDIEAYRYSDLVYSLDTEGYLQHQYSKDLHIALIPDSDKELFDRYVIGIEKEFTVLRRCSVKWTDKHTLANYQRLFARDKKSDLDEKSNTFTCIIFEDKNPRYIRKKEMRHIQSINIERLASKLNGLLGGNAYFSKGLSDFFYMAVLLLGVNRLTSVLGEKSLSYEHIESDLTGTEGWKDFEEFLTVANICTEWLVLRNFEYLPDDFFENDKDVDVLCRDVDAFSQTMNCTKRSWGVGAYETTIDNKVVPFDIRYVGDGYYDTVWESNMLQNRVFHQDMVPRMSDVDYFFSLLYHAKIQKHTVKASYEERLGPLSKQIAFFDYLQEDIFDDEVVASIIESFLLKNSYVIPKPIDIEVPFNQKVTDYMGPKIVLSNAHRIPIKVRLLSYVPSFFFTLIPKQLKVIVKKVLYRDVL